MQIRAQLRQLIDEEPGLTAAELLLSLPPESAPSSAAAVERHLRMMGGVREEARRWYPAPERSAPAATTRSPQRQVSDQEGVPASSRRSPTPARTRASRPGAGPLVAGGDRIRAVEAELRVALYGRRLVAEADLTSARYEELIEILEDELPRLGLDGLARLYPAVFVTFLVAHGVYEYEAGAFWGSIPVAGIDNSAGPLFERRCRELGLVDFGEVLSDEASQRYVAPIVAHGGVPQYCLDDYFGLLVHAVGQVGDSPPDVFDYWSSRKSTFTHVDKPIRRFIQYGGDVSADFVARCIDAISFAHRHGKVPNPADAGLPLYVLRWINSNMDVLRGLRIEAHRRTHRTAPRLVLDPYSPLGPEIELPILPDADRRFWRLSASGGIERRQASPYEPGAFAIAPARSWEIERFRDHQSEALWSFEGFDTSPAIFFEPSDGNYLSPQASVTSTAVWCLASGQPSIRTRRRDEVSDARIIEESSSLIGEWSGFRAWLVDVDGADELIVDDGGRHGRLLVRSGPSRPEVIGDVIDDVTTADGLRVFDAIPTLSLPDDTGLEPFAWKVEVAVDGGEPVQVAVADDYSCALPLVTGAVAKEVAVTVRGPLGSDLRDRFAVADGLRVHVPAEVQLPSSPPHPVQIWLEGGLVDGTPERREFPTPVDSSEVRATVERGGASIGLVVTVPRLLWAVVERTSVGDLSAQQVTIPMQGIIDGDVVGVSIRVGRPDIPLELHLVLDGRTVQSSDKSRTAHASGRSTFDLAPFRDTLRSSPSGSATLILRVGHTPVTIARLRADAGVEDVTITGRVVDAGLAAIHAEFVTTAERERVLRFWPADRTWLPPIELDVEPSATAVHMDLVEGLDTGRYLVEIDTADDWARPQRPKVDGSRVIEWFLGDKNHHEMALLLRQHDDPMEVLDTAVQTGRLPRHLDNDELQLIAGPAMSVLLTYVLDPQPEMSRPRGTNRALSLLRLQPDVLAGAVIEAAEQRRLTRQMATGLALQLARTPWERPPVVTLGDGALRQLWNAAPAVAAIIDLLPLSTLDGATRRAQQERHLDVLGWSTAEGVASLFRGDAVDQVFAGATAERLRAMIPMLDLLPKAILKADALIDANFDWLVRGKAQELDLRSYYATWIQRRCRVGPSTVLAEHLAARTPDAGVETWAGLPALTLETAAALVAPDARPDQRNSAADLLRDILRLAPRLVERDLVLACAIQRLDSESTQEY